MPQIVHKGFGCVRSLSALLAARGSRRVFVVHGPSPVETSRARTLFEGASGTEIAWYGDVPPNPDSAAIARCLEPYSRMRPDAIAAIGGGSVMDTAKILIAMSSGVPESEVIANRFDPGASKPLYWAVPTSAGTGSEATHFAVYYKDGKKYSLANQALRPDEVFLDPELTLTCPRELTLASGADAVCQAVESYWSKGATEKSRRYAVDALPPLLANILAVDDRPDDLEARAAMLYAAHLAGKAIDISKTTAAHAMSYALTSRYHIQHGLAALVAMGPIVELMDRRYRFFDEPSFLDGAFSAFGPRFPEAFAAFRKQALSRMNEATRRAAAGDGEEAAKFLAGGVNAERLSNHPVALSDRDILDAYASILGELGASAPADGGR